MAQLVCSEAGTPVPMFPGSWVPTTSTAPGPEPSGTKYFASQVQARVPIVVRCRPGGPGAGGRRGDQVSLWNPGAVAAAAAEATAMKPPRGPPQSSLWVLGGKGRASSSLGRDDYPARLKGDYRARGEGRSPGGRPARHRPRDRPGSSRQPPPRPRPRHQVPRSWAPGPTGRCRGQRPRPGARPWEGDPRRPGSSPFRSGRPGASGRKGLRPGRGLKEVPPLPRTLPRTGLGQGGGGQVRFRSCHD